MKKVFFFFSLFFCALFGHAQSVDTTQTPSFFRGQVTVTQNGVSLIPNFSLNRPAIMFDLNVGKGRLSFDPMIRFGLNGKPWAFVFWWRYKLIQQKKFMMSLGAHPSLVFRDMSVIDNTGVTRAFLATQRYFAWEASPTYIINKNVNIGLYYLGSHGLSKDIVQYTNFVALRSSMNFHTKKFVLGLIPQVYYLKMDTKDGYYTNLTANFYKKQFPISINAVVSQALKTQIAGKESLYSLGLVCNINNVYLKKNNQ